MFGGFGCGSSVGKAEDVDGEASHHLDEVSESELVEAGVDVICGYGEVEVIGCDSFKVLCPVRGEDAWGGAPFLPSVLGSEMTGENAR